MTIISLPCTVYVPVAVGKSDSEELLDVFLREIGLGAWSRTLGNGGQISKRLGLRGDVSEEKPFWLLWVIRLNRVKSSSFFCKNWNRSMYARDAVSSAP